MPRTKQSSFAASLPFASEDETAVASGAAQPLWANGPDAIHAGTSGWAYPLWKPAFYPAKLPAKRFLDYYASQLNSVEVNYTFRAFPSATTVAGWLAATPPGFRFSFKAPQRITHINRLRSCHEAVERFVQILEPIRLAGRLGPLLFQLPPTFKADAAQLGDFLAAPVLNGPHAPMVAFEFRHQSWFTDEIYAVLRGRNAALCIAESDDLRTPEVHTATTFTCYRLRCSGGYTPDEIQAFAQRFSALVATRELYIYFKHEDEPSGALNAVTFLQACIEEAGK
ncbi:MAG TPA: DUF72 domain-containing protein [Acidobacteriaceae bacterium]|nr:DUF72 domain-containing protein [Acidobacteriaceae bacterium]